MMKKNQTVTVLGDGGWGTTLSILLSKKGYDVCLWGAFKDYIEVLRKKRKNPRFLKGANIPSSIFITSDFKQAFGYAQTIILAVPSQYLRSLLKKMKGLDEKNKIFLSATKGLESKSLMRMSEVIVDELGGVDLAVLSGPNIAREIARGMPAVSVVASRNSRIAKYFQELLMSEKFRIYTNNDVIGVELGGCLKNIIALACGIADGLGFGSNAKAALLTRGLREISRLGIALGAREQTFFGLSGLGDLVTTCSSPHSRNRFVGTQIADGKRLRVIIKKMQMVAEGVFTTRAAYRLSMKHNVDMPITKEINRVLYRNKSPQKAVKDLMLRNKKPEL